MKRGGPSKPPSGPISPPVTARKPRAQTPPGQVLDSPARTPPTDIIPTAAPRPPQAFFHPEGTFAFQSRQAEDIGYTSGGDFLPDRPEEESSDEESSESDSSDEDMSDLTFEGKADTLEDILTHCLVQFLAKPRKYPDDNTKSGFLASKFRGKALTWLTKTIKDDKDILNNFKKFREKLERDFEQSEETRKKAADRRLKTLTQRGAAQSFAIEFDLLADTLGYDDDGKKNAFITRLKLDVRKLLIGTPSTTYSELRAAAITIDEELFALRNPRQKNPNKKGKGTGKPDKSGN